MKLYENTMYYAVIIGAISSRPPMKVIKIKVLKHVGDGCPIQRIYYVYHGNKNSFTWQFYENEIKEQNSHIFKISATTALCLTIADCKKFIRQYYRNKVTTNKYRNWWIPNGWGIPIERIVVLLHNALKEFNTIIKQMEIKPCTQQLPIITHSRENISTS